MSKKRQRNCQESGTALNLNSTLTHQNHFRSVLTLVMVSWGKVLQVRSIIRKTWNYGKARPKPSPTGSQGRVPRGVLTRVVSRLWAGSKRLLARSAPLIQASLSCRGALLSEQRKLRKENGKSGGLLCMRACVLSHFSHVWLYATPRTEVPWLFCPWDSPGKTTRVGCHFLLQELFSTWGPNPGLLQCRQILYHLSYQGSQRPITLR